jgi:hypothetical protein
MRSSLSTLLLLSVMAVACSTETPAAQLPPDGSVVLVDGAPAPDAAAPGQDALPGQDAPAPGDGATDRDASVGEDVLAPPADSGVLDQCNPVTQDCQDAADKCRIEPAMMGQGTQCVERGLADRARGAVCAGGDCAAGLVCVNTGTVARCAQACDRSSGAPCSTLGADYDCRLQVRGTNWGACDQLPPACDPLTLAPCEPTQACQPVRRFDGTFEFRCRAAGSGAEGQRCESAGCARGLVCVREEGVSLCRAPCGMAGPTCTAPQTCVGLVLGVSYCR